MVNLEALEDRIKVTFPNECTIYEAEEIKNSLMKSIPDFSSEIEVELSNIDDLDTTGVQIFLSLKKMMESEGRNIYFTTPSKKVISVLECYNLLSLIKKS